MKLNEIEKSFEGKAFISNGVFLLRPCDARRFVCLAQEQSIPIAGIEGFRRIGEVQIQPVQELSTDLYDFTGDSWQKTLEDLRGPFEDNVWFEVVLEMAKGRQWGRTKNSD